MSRSWVGGGMVNEEPASGSGLMAFWSDFEAEDFEAFQRWHNCEHVTERVSIPGFLAGRRYRNSGKGHQALMIYETRDPEVLASEAYLAALNNPTPWTRRALTWFRNPDRGIYRLLASAGDPAPTEAPFLLAARFNLEEKAEAEVIATYRQCLAEAAQGGLVYRSRLYAIDEAISNVMTSERKIYGGGPGEQRYLLLHEVREEATTLPPDPAMRAPSGAAFQAAHRDLHLDRLWLDFALSAPKG